VSCFNFWYYVESSRKVQTTPFLHNTTFTYTHTYIYIYFPTYTRCLKLSFIDSTLSNLIIPEGISLYFSSLYFSNFYFSKPIKNDKTSPNPTSQQAASLRRLLEFYVPNSNIRERFDAVHSSPYRSTIASAPPALPASLGQYVWVSDNSSEVRW